MRKLITFIFLMVSISSHAFTTKEMLDVCQSEDRYGPEAALCLGYITGLSSEFTGYISGHIAATKKERGLVGERASQDIISEGTEAINQRYGCVMDKPVSQTIAVFVKWAKANPQHWHKLANEGYWMAVSEAFPPPCG